MISIFLPIQILLLAFLIFAFSRVVLRFKEGNITLGAVLFWSGIWIFASFSVIEPEFTTWVANRIGIGRGVDAVIYISVLLLFYLVYRTHIYIENLRHEITQLTRKIALKDQERKKEKQQ